MDERILDTTWRCITECRHAIDKSQFVLTFSKDLIRKGWTERAARLVYFRVTRFLYGVSPKPRKRAVHRVRFSLSR